MLPSTNQINAIINPEFLGYLPGAYNGRTNAIKFGELMTSKHQALINNHKGGKNYKIIKGGNAHTPQQQTVTVTQNHIPGPVISNVNSNTLMVATTKTYLDSINNEDCYATNTCVNSPPQNGGTKRRSISKKRRSISKKRKSISKKRKSRSKKRRSISKKRKSRSKKRN